MTDVNETEVEQPVEPTEVTTEEKEIDSKEVPNSTEEPKTGPSKEELKEMFSEYYKEVREKEREEASKLEAEKKEPVKKDPMEEYLEETTKAKLKQLDYHLEKVCMKEEFPEQFKKYIKYDKNTTESEIESQIEAFSTALKGYSQSLIDEKKSGGIRLQGKGTVGSSSGKKENYGEIIAKAIYGGGNK